MRSPQADRAEPSRTSIGVVTTGAHPSRTATGNEWSAACGSGVSRSHRPEAGAREVSQPRLHNPIHSQGSGKSIPGPPATRRPTVTPGRSDSAVDTLRLDAPAWSDAHSRTARARQWRGADSWPAARTLAGGAGASRASLRHPRRRRGARSGRAFRVRRGRRVPGPQPPTPALFVFGQRSTMPGGRRARVRPRVNSSWSLEGRIRLVRSVRVPHSPGWNPSALPAPSTPHRAHAGRPAAGSPRSALASVGVPPQAKASAGTRGPSRLNSRGRKGRRRRAWLAARAKQGGGTHDCPRARANRVRRWSSGRRLCPRTARRLRAGRTTTTAAAFCSFRTTSASESHARRPRRARRAAGRVGHVDVEPRRARRLSLRT
jgi:hypothetical protein